MHKSTAKALYALHIDTFLTGLASTIPDPMKFNLTEDEAVQIRVEQYSDRIRRHRSKKAKAA
jgi:hypothetical protein